MFNKFSFSFRSKILLIVLLTGIIPISISGYLSNLKYNQLLEDQAHDITEQALKQGDGYISMYLSELEWLGTTIATNQLVLDTLNKSYSSIYDKVLDAGNIKQALSQYIYSRWDIERIDLFGFNGFSFTGGYSMYPIDESEPWVQEVMKRDGQPYWFFSENQDQDFIEYSRVISQNGQPLGIIRIMLPSYRLDTIIKKYQPNNTGFLFLIDKNHHSLIDSNEAVSEIIDRLDYSHNTKYQYVSLHGMEMLVTIHQLESVDWIFVSVIPREDILKGTGQIREYFLNTAIVILLITLTLVFWIIRYFTKPIKEVIGLMHDVENSNFTSRMTIRTNDDIGMLAKSYNRMVQRVRELIEKVYEQQRLKNEAQWSALQAQINPHFLYNTLDSINWMARMNNIPDISKMITALSMLFKLSLSKTDKYILIEEELMYIKYYAQIQEIRFSDRIHIYVDVPDSILKYKIPRFILQPLVENAVIHGLEPKEDPGEIHIKGGEYEDKVFFIIQDNGVGIPEERLKELLLPKPNDSDHSQHLGLNNVDERIKLLYGQEWGLKIDSIENMGTIVEVWLLKDFLKGGTSQ
ncbi:sensor histidine kinase [Paenibacillus sp. FSL R10-2734]|uniref:sensor histidine kinase n=1 Tax=Paenibacillus sp. FSL R10-2734 TaxID=2954691 RepID=UPI0030D93EAD